MFPLSNPGILTFDGQHTNEQGTQTLVRVIAREMLRWKDMWRQAVADGGVGTRSGHRHGDMKRRRREEREKEIELEDEKRMREG